MDDRTMPAADLAAQIPMLLGHQDLTARLADAARTLPSSVTSDARRDAVALVTACANQLPAMCEQISSAWLAGDGHAQTRTWALAREALLIAAVLAGGQHRADGSPLLTFPDPIPVAATDARSLLHELVSGLIAAQVRGEQTRVDLTFAVYLAPHTPPADTINFVRALVEVATGHALTRAHTAGQSLERVLGTLGIVASVAPSEVLR